MRDSVSVLGLICAVGVAACGSSSDGSTASDVREAGGADGMGAGGVGLGVVGGAGINGVGGAASTGSAGLNAGGSNAGGSNAGGSNAGGSGHGGSVGKGGASGTGGANDTGTGGGAVGNDGGPPHIVGACDGLGAVNQWEQITPSQVDASQGLGIVEILADPVHAGTVYAGTDHHGVYKSTDCGAHWMKINTGRDAAVLDSGTQWSMAIDPVEPNVLYAGSLYGSDPSLLKSTNGGVDWDSVFPADSEVAKTVEYNFFQEISLEPTDHRHLVVSFHANCKAPYAPMCMAESKDSGATWRLFKGPTSGWAEDSRPLVIGPNSWLFATHQDGLFYTGDSGVTWENVGPGARHQMYHSKGGYYYVGSFSGILRSPDGHTWTKVNPTAPITDGLWGDGTRIFTSSLTPVGGQPFFTTLESDGATWTALASPTITGGTDYFAYEADHHVLYASNLTSGLWRMVTK